MNESDRPSEIDANQPPEAAAPEARPAGQVAGGGAYVAGDVDTRGGDFIGRDQIIITAEKTYDVSGLPNPYLGLRSFTYADRPAYAGRLASVREALERLLTPGGRCSLLFVTGASGSGKSSFVQAGLLPELENVYGNLGRSARWSILRPGADPLAALAVTLAQLGLPRQAAADFGRLPPARLNLFVSENTPADSVNLLVIDPFEELFTQSPPEGRDFVFGFLSGLPAFETGRTQVIAALRSDYLDELFDFQPVWEIAVRQGIELRAMRVEELKDAIQQPLWAAATRDERYRGKQFEPALLERLAEESAEDAAYLPLLQVTLQRLWSGGGLTLARYGRLTDAIRARAEEVYAYEDFSHAAPVRERSEADRAAVLEIFLDLVDVSLKDDPRRDVRRTRPLDELARRSPARRALVTGLVEARLLSVSVVGQAPTALEKVDVIHESLIQNWDRLQQAIAGRRQTLQRRARFEAALEEWLDHHRSDDYLLVGVRLAEAQELARAADIALDSAPAQELLQRSLARADAAHQRELALERRSRRLLMGLMAVLSLAIMFIVVLQYPQILRLRAHGPLVQFPAGTVRVGMDQPPVDFPEEGPSRTFPLQAFALERYEVSNRRYRWCVQAGRCDSPSDPQQYYYDETKADHPVVGVSALQAYEFCRWIGRRLPNELEWERAARGAEGRDWPWEDDLPVDSHANLQYSRQPFHTDPVDSHPDGASPEGVYNLIGNATEWTASYYQTYEDYDPQWVWDGIRDHLDFDVPLVQRGGGWSMDTLRSTARRFVPATQPSDAVGFRCAK